MPLSAPLPAIEQEQAATALSTARRDEERARAGLWAAIVVTFAWHVISVLPAVISGWVTYGFVASNAAFWFVYAAIGGITTWVVLRGGGQSLALAWAVCPILLAGVIIGSFAAPGGFFGRYNWAFSVCGWFALVALWRRRLTELLIFFAANWLIGGATMIAQHQTDRLSLARFIVDCVGTSVLEITIFVGGKTVAATARRAAEAEDAVARSRIGRLAAEAVQAARRANYEAIRGTVAGLLDGLAEGRLDMTALGARQEVAVAVTRLRRYLVETDEVPDQLSHELNACADAAERRGIAVDLIAAAGTIPSLPVEIRRALTEPIIQVLAAAATQARITVVASATEVVAAIMADAHLDTPVAIVAVGKSIEAALDGPGRDADVVVLDLELGDRESGKQMVTPRVAGLCAEGFRVVVFSMHVEPLIVQAVMQAGACAFLDKQTEEDQFVDTIVAVAQDRPFVTPSMAGGILNGVQLSSREREALQYLFQGMTYASIARRLTKADGKPISALTAKDYINRARAKFAAAGVPCKSNYALLARCIGLGLIRPEEIEDYHPGELGA